MVVPADAEHRRQPPPHIYVVYVPPSDSDAHFSRGGSRPKNPGRIRDGSTIRIRPGLVCLFPAIREQYVRTIYSGSIRMHYLRTYFVCSYTRTGSVTGVTGSG
jgi:hypothetical protein